MNIKENTTGMQTSDMKHIITKKNLKREHIQKKKVEKNTSRADNKKLSLTKNKQTSENQRHLCSKTTQCLIIYSREST